MLEHLYRDGEVELGVAERKALEVRAQELGIDPDDRRGTACSFENALGDVDPDYPLRRWPEPRERSEVASVSAAGVQVRLCGQQGAQLLGEHRELPVERRVRNDRLTVFHSTTLLVDVTQMVGWRDLGHG